MYQATTKSDLQIQQDVLREFLWDSRVGATEIGVEVDKGIVTLTGTVDSFAKKLAAKKAAHRVAGVLDVAEDKRVHFPGSARTTDAEVATAVRHALEWDVFVPDDRIRSTVSEGWVTLEGEVDLLREREDAARAVRNLAGVKGVWNQITIQPKKVNPVEIRKRIEEALERRAEREAERIQVEVHDGSVTLMGRVRSWNEKEAVAGAAGFAPGVRSIQDKLRVDPFF